jgi:hypothetical protein
MSFESPISFSNLSGFIMLSSCDEMEVAEDGRLERVECESNARRDTTGVMAGL